MEHRWGERLWVALPVRVTTHRFSVRDGLLADLSVSGAYIQTAFQARVQSRIEVAIMLPPRLRYASPLLCAYVARRYKSGFGVEWCEFGPPAIKDLLHAVAVRPYAHHHRLRALASLHVVGLSAPLLKHGA
jgi:hypothetical protein